MVIKLEKDLEIVKEEGNISLPKDILEKIEIFWKKQTEENPHLFNGEVWSVTKIEELEEKIRLTIQKTNYAHYLYDERVGLDKKFACYNLNGGILLETIDKKYIVGEMDETTSYAPMLKGFLKFTSEEMKKYYKDYKEYLTQTNQEVEFTKLHFINKENALEQLNTMDNPKRPYLRDLLYMHSQK